MAGRGISIDILANVRDALKGTGDVEKALSDIESTIDDLERSGETSTDRMSRGFRDLARDADASADKLERSYKDAYRDIGRASKDAGDDMKKGLGDGLDDVKDEAKQSGREAAASFSGEFDDVTDYVQEVVAQGLGPAGIAGAALIGAVGAVATAAIEAWNEKIDAIKDATAQMWQEAAAEGSRFIDQSAIQAEAHRILWDDAYKDDLAAAERAGIKRSDLAIALATGEGAVFEDVHRRFMEARDEEAAKTQENYDKYAQGAEGLIRLEGVEGQQIGRTLELLDEKSRSVDENKKRAEDAQAATNALHEQERSQIQRTRDADQARYEALAAAREKASKPIVVPIQIDDSAVRRYRPPEIVIRSRLGAPRDVFWE